MKVQAMEMPMEIAMMEIEMVWIMEIIMKVMLMVMPMEI